MLKRRRLRGRREKKAGGWDVAGKEGRTKRMQGGMPRGRRQERAGGGRKPIGRIEERAKG